MALFRIRYKGLSDVRAITKKDAKALGVNLSADLVWDHVGAVRGGQIAEVKRPDYPNAAKGIFVDGLSDDLLDLLRSEGTFTVTEIKDGESGPEDGDEIITGERIDDTGSVVRDTTSGQVAVDPKAAVDSGTVKGQQKAGRTTA